MKSKIIRIDSLNDIKEFHSRVFSLDGDIILSRGHTVVDARSFLGVFAIDTSQPTKITYPEYLTSFDKYLEKFEVSKEEIDTI